MSFPARNHQFLATGVQIIGREAVEPTYSSYFNPSNLKLIEAPGRGSDLIATQGRCQSAAF